MSSDNLRQKRDEELPSNRSNDGFDKSNKKKTIRQQEQEPVSTGILPNVVKKNPKTFSFLTVGAILYGSIWGYIAFSPLYQPPVYVNMQFDFYVYCPYNLSDLPKSQLRRLGDEENNIIPTYGVYIMSQFNPTTNQTGFYYCGNVTTWDNRDCSNPNKIHSYCTFPGPMFYVQRDKPIDVVWMNMIGKKLNKTTLQLEIDSFAIDNIKEENYPIHDRVDAKRKGQELFTYLDPTQINNTNANLQARVIEFDKRNLPISTHIHGLQVRPTFDGNPLSWTNGDQVGVGYQSLDGDGDGKINLNPFYSFFKDHMATAFKPTKQQKLYAKVNRYMNNQSAGNLWYHDHGMRATMFNVKHGLAGVYIIYDKKVQQKLPSGEYQKFVLITGGSYKDANVTNFIYKSKGIYSSEQAYQIQSKKIGSNEQINKANIGQNKTNQTTPFQRRPYRFRLLNANIDGFVSLIVFSYSQNTPVQSQKNLSMSIVGADSTLFDSSMDNITQVYLAASQRLQVIVDFSMLPANVTEVHLTTKNAHLRPDNISDLHYTLYIPENATTIKGDQHYQTGVPYFNLTKIKQEEISVKRMRSFKLSDNNVTFNMHHMFTMGQSQNPKIGTVEDWYLINGMPGPHPIHIHLINFQVLSNFVLKRFNNTNCTYYIMDQIRKINKTHFQSYNNSKMCDVAWNVTKYNVTFTLPNGTTVVDTVQNALYHFHLEHDIDKNTKISGMDVFEQGDKKEIQANYSHNASQCDQKFKNTHKFICKNTTDDMFAKKPWYGKWKDVAMVDPFEMLVYRIRWASTEKQHPLTYPYFNIGEDQLTEFPGFIYHCHILFHQDSELMRPIMLQLSDQFIANNRDPNDEFKNCSSDKIWTWDWKDRVPCINTKVNQTKKSHYSK